MLGGEPDAVNALPGMKPLNDYAHGNRVAADPLHVVFRRTGASGPKVDFPYTENFASMLICIDFQALLPSPRLRPKPCRACGTFRSLERPVLQ